MKPWPSSTRHVYRFLVLIKCFPSFMTNSEPFLDGLHSPPSALLLKASFSSTTRLFKMQVSLVPTPSSKAPSTTLAPLTDRLHPALLLLDTRASLALGLYVTE